MRLLFALAALALPAAPALAQDQGPEGGPPSGQPPRERPSPPTIFVEPVGMMIAAFDADGDGRVTRAEFDAGLRHSFDYVDKSHRGLMGYIDFGDWAERWLGDRNALPSPFEIDRNGDNTITFDEVKDRFDQLFDRFDADKDGVIVRSELLTIHAARFGGDQPFGGGRGGRRGGGGRRGPGGGMGRPGGGGGGMSGPDE